MPHMSRNTFIATLIDKELSEDVITTNWVCKLKLMAQSPNCVGNNTLLDY